jgi:hypothetical protein
VYFDVKEECMAKGCDSKTCKFGCRYSGNFNKLKKYPSEKQMWMEK